MRQVFIASAILMLASSAFAQSQRLGLPTGTFTLGAIGKVARRGYCMDAGVPAPAPGVTLSNILTDASHIEVKIGGAAPKSLQAALDAKEIKLEAKAQFDGMSVKQVMSSSKVPVGTRLVLLVERAKHRTLFKEIENKPATEASKLIEGYVTLRNLDKAEAQTLLDIGKMLSGGDGENVVFANMTGQDIEVNIKQVSVVSEYKSSLHDVNLANVIPSNSDASQKEIQDRIWADNSAIHAAGSGRIATEYVRSEDARTPVKSFLEVGSQTLVLVTVLGKLELRIVEGGKVVSRFDGDTALVKFTTALADYSASVGGQRSRIGMISRHHDGKPGTVRLNVGKVSVEMTDAEFTSLVHSGNIPETLDAQLRTLPRGTRFILWRDPVTRESAPDRFQDYTELATVLEAKYGETLEVFLDDDVPAALRRIDSLDLISNAKDIALVSDKLSFPVKDHGIVEAVESDLESVGAVVYRDVTEAKANEGIGIAPPNLLVLTGHKDAAFRRYLFALHDGGILENRVVLMFSCYAERDEAMNSTILSLDKPPKAMIFFPDELDATAVTDVLHHFGERVKEQSELKPEKIRTILNESIDRVLKDPQSSERIKNEATKLRRAVIQVSALCDSSQVMPV